jgi:acyl carrier protein
MPTTPPQVDSIHERIREFVVDAFPQARSRAVQPHTPLLESGILDSLGVLSLVAFLQDQLGVRVDDEDLVPENFQTIERVAAFACRKLWDEAAA